jgi:hypothetical protein
MERLKQDLSLVADFNVQDCIRVFDVEQRGTISMRQLEEGF